MSGEITITITEIADAVSAVAVPASVTVSPGAGTTGPQGPAGPTGPTGATGATGQGVAVGGSTGQVLAKASATDYDTEWVDQAGGGGGGAVDSVNGETGTVVLSASDVGAQPVDSDLTAIAALSTATFGRSLLTQADAATARTTLGAGTSSLALGTSSSTAKAGDYQPAAANISDSTTIGRTILTAANAAAVKTALSLATVATTGAYSDLSGKPTIPSGVPWFNVKDAAYGAVGDGSTDDTSAINAAIAALNSAGTGVLYFPATSASYKTTAALTTINVPATVMGDGCADSHFRDAPSTITLNSRTAVMFTVGTSGHGTKFCDLNLQNTAALAPTAGAAIQVLGGDGARYERLSIAGFWINMDMQDGQEWTMDSCFIYSPVKYGIKLQHVDLPDGGDMGITNCQFLCGDYDADAAIRWESGGGLRLTNCKINTRTLSHFFDAGLDAAIGNITTVDLLVGACSFENITGPCIKGTVAGQFSAVAIVGNQFGYYSSTSFAAVDITGWIDVTVVANTALARFSGSSAAAVKLTSVTRGTVALNTVEGFSGGELSQTSCTGISTASAHTHAESDITNLTTDLAAKAPLASPTFTGTPAAPTATGGTNTTQIATTAFVASATSALAPLASPTFTGHPVGVTETAGTNSTRLATTAYADNAVAKQQEVLMFALSDETTAITTGLKLTARMPFAMTLTSVRASLTTASTSGNPAVNIKESGTTIFSTTLTIDANELTSQTAATAAVLSDTSLADDAEMTFIVDTAGTGAKGLKVTLIGTRT